MARQDVFIKIQIKGAAESKKEIDGVSNASRKLSKEQRLLKKGIDNLNESEKAYLVNLERERIASQNTRFEISKLAVAKDKAGKSTTNFRTQAGLNNAILLESGRLASDLSFGFTAIANNLSQLVSLFTSFVATTGSVKESLNQLKQSIFGIGGVMLAVQLLIAAFQTESVRNFISDIFGASRALRTLRKALSEATDVYGAQIGKLTALQSLINDGIVTDRQKGMALQQMKDDYDGLNVSLNKNNELTEESNENITGYIEVIKRLAKTKILLEAIGEETANLFKAQAEASREPVTFFEKLTREFVDFGKQLGDFVVPAIGIGGFLALESLDPEKEIEKLQGVLEVLQKKLEEVFEYDPNADSGGGLSKRLRLLRINLLDLSKLEERYRKQSIDQDLMTEEEKIRNLENDSKRELEVRINTYKQAAEDKHKNFMEQLSRDLKDQRITKAQFKAGEEQADKELNDAIASIAQERQDVITQIEAVTNTKFEQLTRRRREKYIENFNKTLEIDRANIQSKKELDLEEDTMAGNFERRSKGAIGVLQDLLLSRRQDTDESRLRLDFLIESNEAELEFIQDQIDSNDRLIESLELKGELTEAQSLMLSDARLREAELDSQYTQKSIQNSELRRKISDAEAMAKVESIKIVGDAMNAFSDLAGKDTETGKRLAIAGTLISTYLSAQKAFESQFKPVAEASSPVRGAAAAAVALVQGLARVKAIRSVKTSGSNSEVRVQAPAFNVVGASPQDRLGSVIREELGGQQQQTVKAVVSLNDLDLANETRENINRNNSLD